MTQEILDPTLNLDEWVPARRRRLLLAAYIDFSLFSVAWGLVLFSIQLAFPAISELPRVTKWVVFSILEVMLLRLGTWSPGAQLLGIRFVPVREHAAPIDRLWQGHVPHVSRRIKERESWYTLLLATWTLNEGCKSLIRWTLWNPPVPFFGQPTDEIVSTIIFLVSGICEILIAVWLYRVDIRAVVFGIPYNLIQLVSAALSWDLWDAWVAEMIVRRREFQGIPVREGEIESMQSLTPELVVAAGAIGIVLLLIAVPRLRGTATQLHI